MLQASDVEWQMGQFSGASGVNDGSDDGDTEEQSEPAETAERPSGFKVQIVKVGNPAGLRLLAAVMAVGGLCCGRCTLQNLQQQHACITGV